MPAPNDGGQHFAGSRLDVAVANIGSLNAGALAASFAGPSPWVDITTLGALSGDTTGASLDAAIAALITAYPSGGVNVFVPPGVFYGGIGDGTTKYAYQLKTSNWRFIGAGKGISILRLVNNSTINGAGGQTGWFRLDGSASTTPINNFSFENLTMDGNGWNQTTTPLSAGNTRDGYAAVTVLGRVRGYKFVDCELINWSGGGVGIYPLGSDKTQRPAMGLIDRCEVNGNWEGLMTGGADGLSIANSYFLGNSDNGIDGNGSLNVNIDNCDCSYNGSPVTTYGATTFANEGNGILMFGNRTSNDGSHSWSISNSRFRSNSQGQVGSGKSASRDGIRFHDSNKLETTDLLVTNCQCWDDFNLITDTLAATIAAGSIGDILTQNVFSTPSRWPRWGFLWLTIGTDTFMLQRPALGGASVTIMRITANGAQTAGVTITGIQCQAYGISRYDTADNAQVINCSLQGNRLGAVLLDPTTIAPQAIHVQQCEGYNPLASATVSYPGTNTPTPVSAADATFTISGGTITAVKIGLPTPNRVRFNALGTGGALTNNTAYFYRMSALNAAGETVASAEASITTPSGANTCSIVVYSAAVIGATSYKFYGRTTGAELLMATVTAPFNTFTPLFTDDGSVTPSGALPAANTTGVATNITAAAAAGSVHTVRVPAGQSLIITSSVNPTLQAFYD